MNKKIEDIMAGFEPSLIAGFDSSLIEGILRKNFGYEGRIDNLKREEEETVVKLYNKEGLDVTIIRKDYFELKSIIVTKYIVPITLRGGVGQHIIELIDRRRQLSMIGYGVEDKNG